MPPQSGFKEPLMSLPLNGHAQNVGCPLEERNVFLVEIAIRPAVDLKDAEGRTVALQNDVHGSRNIVTRE